MERDGLALGVEQAQAFAEQPEIPRGRIAEEGHVSLHDIVALPAHGVEDDDREAVRVRHLDALGDVAEHIAQDLAAAQHSQLLVADLAVVAQRASLALVIGTEALGVGLGTAAFVAFIARTTHPAYTATQFALFTSLAAVPRTVINASAGWLVESLGWPVFFLLCALLALPGMALLLNFLLTPTSSLAPLLITKYFGKGALEFGLFDSAWGFGLIAGGLLLGIWGGFKRKVATSMMGIIGIGIGIGMAGFAPANAFWLALVGMTITGITNPLANGPLIALLQSIVRPDMQGRVMALVGSFATAMTPLGLLVAGPVSDAIGIRAWYWIAGTVTLLMGIAGFFIPAVMHVEDQRDARHPRIRHGARAGDRGEHGRSDRQGRFANHIYGRTGDVPEPGAIDVSSWKSGSH